MSKEIYYFLISVLNQSYWITGSLLGSLFGQMISINTNGVDFAMTALFVVILTDNLLKQSSRYSAIIGLIISFICLLIFGANNFLIPSMIGITLGLIAFKKIIERGNDNA